MRIRWPQLRDPAVSLPGPDHPNTIRVAGHIIDHARAGRKALAAAQMSEAKYHRDFCSWLLWRLGVDGITSDGQLRYDAAKYETRLPGRLSTEAARAVRESPSFARRAQGALGIHVACDHIVPRNCVAEALISPGWIDLDDEAVARAFVITHAEVAILSPEENLRLQKAGWESDIPDVWWNAPIQEKQEHRMARYEAIGLVVTPWKR